MQGTRSGLLFQQVATPHEQYVVFVQGRQSCGLLVGGLLLLVPDPPPPGLQDCCRADLEEMPGAFDSYGREVLDAHLGEGFEHPSGNHVIDF